MTVNRLPLALAASSIFIGFLVLLGWYTHNESLIQILPTFVPMQYNTALGFLLSGLGLISWFRKRRVFASLFGLLVLLVGGLTLFQYIGGYNFGIDQLFMKHYITTETSHPGRMAPNTALCFSLTGLLMIIGLRVQNKNLSYELLNLGSILVTSLGVVAFFGYLFQIESAFGWLSLTRMAVHTSIGFILIGIASYIHIGKAVHQKRFFWTSVIFSLIFLLLTFSLYAEIVKQNDRYVSSLVSKKINVAISEINELFREKILAFRRMADRWEAAKGMDEDLWRSDAKNYINDFKPIKVIEWIDVKDKVRWVEPLEGNEQVIGLNIMFNDKRREELGGVRSNKGIVVTEPISLVQGYDALFVAAPLNIEGDYHGFLLAIIDVNFISQDLLSLSVGKDLDYRLCINDRVVFTSAQGGIFGDNSKYLQSHSIKVADDEWKLEAYPNSRFSESPAISLEYYVLVGGLFLSIFVGISVYLFLIRREQNETIYQQNESLKARQFAIDQASIVAITDLAGKINYVNKKFEEISKFSRSELLGKTHGIINSDYHSKEFFKNLWDTVSAGNVWQGEIRNKAKDGSIYWVDTTIVPFKLNGKISQYMAIKNDITDRKIFEDNLERTNHELEQFAYIASHDLQEPLRKIQSFSELLESEASDKLSDDAKDYIYRIKRSTKRMKDLIVALLSYSRATDMTDEYSRCNLNEVLHEVIDRLDLKIKETNAEIKLDILPVVYGNRIQLIQVFQNVIQNSLKYQTAGNQPKISILNKKGHRDFVKIEVCDNGIGFDEKYKTKIFEPFKRLELRSNYEGAGIGLALCKKIINQHGGIISANSTLGEGSSFIIELPLLN